MKLFAKKGQKKDKNGTRKQGGGFLYDKIDYDLFSSQQHLLTAIEGLRDGIGFIDTDGRLIYMNKAFCNIHEIPSGKEQAVLGKPWELVYSVKGQRQIRDHVLPHLSRHGEWFGESIVECQDGTLKYAELSLTRLDDGSLVGTARDVSDRVRAEKENEALQKQIFQSQKMEAIGRLASGIAHDFNNILASIMGYAEFLYEDLSPESAQHGFAARIRQAGIQARYLVDQIMNFSRQSSGDRDVVDFSTLVSDNALLLKSTLSKTTRVELDVAPGKYILYGNTTQLSQLLMNLCLNAVDAIGEQHGTLSLSLSPAKPEDFDDEALLADELITVRKDYEHHFETAEDGTALYTLGTVCRSLPYIRLVVEDTGGGIPAEIMEQVFDPFFTTKSFDKGSGLGLSSVLGILIGHQAAMRVRSTVQAGTRFEMFFPVQDDVIRGANHGDVSVTATMQDEISILLVEDQDSVREMLTYMLERMGHKVYACENGLEAIDHLREHPDCYDAVLTDYTMPYVTGLELAQQAHEDFPKLPFVLLSGYSQAKLEDVLAEYPYVKASIKKPVNKATLERALVDCFRDR